MSQQLDGSNVSASEVTGELLYETTTGEGPLGEAVAQAVATAVDAELKEMEPLYESVDPEALENLFQRTTATPRYVSFEHAGVRVLVDGTWIGVCEVE